MPLAAADLHSTTQGGCFCTRNTLLRCSSSEHTRGEILLNSCSNALRGCVTGKQHGRRSGPIRRQRRRDCGNPMTNTIGNAGQVLHGAGKVCSFMDAQAWPAPRFHATLRTFTSVSVRPHVLKLTATARVWCFNQQ